MHINALDTYLPGDSPVHRLDPRVKVVLTLLLILTAAVTPDGRWAAFCALQAALLVFACVARMGLGRHARRSAVALPFALAALTVAFSTRGAVLWEGRVAGVVLTVTLEGLVRFASIVARSFLSVQGAVVLAGTTKFPDILRALRSLRVPSVLIAVAGFLYRYLFVLADEARRMMRAREARSAARSGGGGRNVSWRARVAGGMAGSLFIRSYERSERIYDAMVARGYDGEVRTLRAPTLRRADVIVGVVVGAALVTLLALGRIVGGYDLLHRYCGP